MKKLAPALLLSTALSLNACGQIGQQWLDPDKTFALFDQPTVKGVNDTQEDMAKDAAMAGDYARATQFYQQLINSKKGTPEQILRYKLGMADATRRAGNTERALAMYEELHGQNPTNLDVSEGRGLSLMAAGKTTDAGRAFSDVIEKDPKRWRSLNALGILFVTKNMIPEAMAYYTEALNQSPDNAAILNNVGLSYATDRNFPRAIEALQQASRVSKTPSQRKQIDLNLAMVYGVSGDFDTSRDLASKYLEGPALDNNMGLYAHLAKDDALAKSYLNMALSQSPTYYERAWENLDAINDSGRGDSTDAKTVATPKPSADAKLPALDPVIAPAPTSKKSKKTRGKKPTAALQTPPVIEQAAAAKPVEDAAMIVEPTATATPTAAVEEKSEAASVLADKAAAVIEKKPETPAAEVPKAPAPLKSEGLGLSPMPAPGITKVE
ncbi:MAG: tetratricopeptide repeat protein [Rickettsiales bacterium]